MGKSLFVSVRNNCSLKDLKKPLTSETNSDFKEASIKITRSNKKRKKRSQDSLGKISEISENH